MEKYKSFETNRLILKPTIEEDAPFIFELVNTPKWLHYIGDRKVKSIKDAIAYIQNKMLPQLEKLKYGNYTVIRKSDQAKLGTCGLYDREGLEGIDIGFALLPDYEKKGYAFEAADKIIQVGFEKFGIPEIQAITTKENISSQKILEKLGLTFERIIELPDDNEELMLYGLKNNLEQ